jgi:CO/xanthine dehydrogenase Mo-binding subunit
MRESDKHNADHHTTDDALVLARRDFLKTAGVVVVGIGVANASSAQAPAGGSGAWQRGTQSGPPDPAAIDSHIAIRPNNTATIYLGYVDLGQGGPTALCQIAAEELDLEFSQVSIGAEIPRISPDIAPFKPRGEYKIVGTSVPRLDMLEKVRGTYQYVQHVRVAGMLHGRVVWPQGQVAGGVTPPKVISIDESSIKNIPGIVIVRRQNFVAVAAEREWDAVRAARQLKVEWEPFPAVFPGHDRIHDTFRAATTNDDVVVNTGNAETAFSQQGLRVASASYRGPYESHGTMAPNCAVADVKADSALVMCSAQGIYQTRASVAGVTGLPADNVRVQYYAGSNTYGSSCYTDAAEAAAIMSQELGKPVRLQLSRQDEFGWPTTARLISLKCEGQSMLLARSSPSNIRRGDMTVRGLVPPRDSWRWDRRRTYRQRAS